MELKEFVSKINLQQEIIDKVIPLVEDNKLEYQNYVEGLSNKDLSESTFQLLQDKYNDDTKVAMKESGYEMGFTIEHGYADREDDFSMLDRICIDYTFGWNNVNYIINNINK